MDYTKITNQIICSLNSLIVRLRETADYTRKNGTTTEDSAGLYAPFWDLMADRAESMADSVRDTLRPVTDIAGHPDRITACFAVMKALEDTAFYANIMAFQAGLTLARAEPLYREAFQPLYHRFIDLARKASLHTEKIAAFFNELSEIILADMRENAERLLRDALQKGDEAVLALRPDYPYSYIAEALTEARDELAQMGNQAPGTGGLTAQRLEEVLTTLEIVTLAADTDLLRAPSHRQILEGVYAFRDRVRALLSFLQNLDDPQMPTESSPDVPIQRTEENSLPIWLFRGRYCCSFSKARSRRWPPFLWRMSSVQRLQRSVKSWSGLFTPPKNRQKPRSWKRCGSCLPSCARRWETWGNHWEPGARPWNMWQRSLGSSPAPFLHNSTPAAG